MANVSPAMFVFFLFFVSSSFLVTCVHSVSVRSAHDDFQRRKLGEYLNDDDRPKFEDLMKQSNDIRREIATLSRSLPNESASDQIKEKNDILQSIIRAMLEISQVDSANLRRNPAAERAIERARQRDAIRRSEAEKKKKEEEDVTYVQNLRKMELVDHTVSDLFSRAKTLGLNDYGNETIFFIRRVIDISHRN